MNCLINNYEFLLQYCDSLLLFEDFVKVTGGNLLALFRWWLRQKKTEHKETDGDEAKRSEYRLIEWTKPEQEMDRSKLYYH